jgi:hypothetical protein
MRSGEISIFGKTFVPNFPNKNVIFYINDKGAIKGLKLGDF